MFCVRGNLHSHRFSIPERRRNIFTQNWKVNLMCYVVVKPVTDYTLEVENIEIEIPR